jgi:hypothetical protein
VLLLLYPMLPLPRVVAADIAEDDQAVRHSPEALAEVLEPLAREGSARRAESASAYPA